MCDRLIICRFKPYFYIAIECYCFQSFKELLAFFATQFFDWGAKVRAVCIQTKFFFTFSVNLLLIFRATLFEELVLLSAVFLSGLQRYSEIVLQQNFIQLFLKILSHLLSHY